MANWEFLHGWTIQFTRSCNRDDFGRWKFNFSEWNDVKGASMLWRECLSTAFLPDGSIYEANRQICVKTYIEKETGQHTWKIHKAQDTVEDAHRRRCLKSRYADKTHSEEARVSGVQFNNKSTYYIHTWKKLVTLVTMSPPIFWIFRQILGWERNFRRF